MSKSTETVAERRNYLVTSVAEAKKITKIYLATFELDAAVALGLPEVDDRYHIWRIPLKKKGGQRGFIGEVVIDAYTSEVMMDRTTDTGLLEARLLGRTDDYIERTRVKPIYSVSKLRNAVGLGDCIELMAEMPSESVDLVFTSPPYYNARPQYGEYLEYEDYLLFMRKVIKEAARVLQEGKFFVINCSPVLVRRASRSESSQRIAVPFDLHRIFIEEGFDFVDDIIWVKPEGAGWATGRGRRFAADRNPMQYKAVPVTEYVLVFRKKSDLLIDWFIRNHPDRGTVQDSKVGDDYERSNIWRINPQTRSKHPAAFPLELAQKVIRYYSFKNDVVMDPFAGSGTVGIAAAALERRFVLLEIEPEYVALIKDSLLGGGMNPEQVIWINTEAPRAEPSLF